MEKAAYNEAVMTLNAILQPKALMESAERTLRQVNEINRAVIGSVQQAVNANWDLAQRISRCTDPTETVQVCKEWLNGRRDAVITEGRNLSTLCIQLYESEGPLAAASRASADATVVASNVSTMQRPMAAGD